LALSDTPSRSFLPDAALRGLPAVLVIAVACRLAWFERGTIASRDWLGYALLGGLLLVVVLAAGRIYAPRRLALAGIVSLIALGVWTAVAVSWSPQPTLGREEVFLIGFYSVVLAFPLLLLRSNLDRELLLAAIVLGLAIVAVASAAEMVVDPAESMFFSGRLVYPVSYVNANAAFFLVGFWPAIALAAHRGASVLLRVPSMAAAATFLAAWLATQSKGAGAALAASAIACLVVARSRLRWLVPALVSAVIAGAAFYPLTAGYRAEDAALTEAARETGRAWLIVTAVAFAVAVPYVLLDRRVTVAPRLHRAAGAIAIGLLVALMAAGLVGFLAAVDEPGRYLRERVDELRGTAVAGQRPTHFATLESYRYDSWRVALREAERHPLAGIGSRGFYAAYLEHGRTVETPTRAHSLPLDVLAETGVVGLALLLVALGAPMAAAFREARASLANTACVVACVYWLVHASFDWIWTLPVCGLVFFCLLGAASAGRDTIPLSGRARALAGLVVATIALAVFLPAWLASRYVSRALGESAAAARVDLERARALDPISTTTYVVEAQLTQDPKRRAVILVKAVKKEPRSAGLRLLLGVAYRDAGMREPARRELEIANRLAPRDKAIERVLDQVR
jgi:hypothetical protein